MVRYDVVILVSEKYHLVIYELYRISEMFLSLLTSEYLM